MLKNTHLFKPSTYASIFSVLVLVCALLLSVTVQAAQLTTRSVELGSSAASATTTHEYTYTIATTANIGSIRYQYCTAATGTCNAPSNMDADGASISSQTGATGFSISATPTDANNIVVTRSAASLTATTVVNHTFSNVDNPDTSNTTFYVRITTYTGTDGSTGATDTGTVASSTANQITVTASVDETLTFCVYTGVNCAASGSSVALGSLTSSGLTDGVSKMDAGTNASGGYAIQYTGPTLTSGANTITAAGATGTASTTGSSQFGINATGPNTNVTGSAAPSGGSGAAANNYDTADEYAFVASTPTTIATAGGPTNSTTFTVSYIANIGTAQAAGAYTTTITYICTATF